MAYVFFIPVERFLSFHKKERIMREEKDSGEREYLYAEVLKSIPDLKASGILPSLSRIYSCYYRLRKLL
jgi:hypothetical protein